MNSISEKLILSLVFVPALFGIFKGPKEMTVATGAIAIALFFSNIDRFSYFRGGGIEARLRDAVKEAYAAIEELKDLGLALSSPIVDELAVSGQFLQFVHLKYKLDRVSKIAETLKRLGASEAELEEACSTLYERVESDHINALLRSLKASNPDKDQLFQGIDEGKFSNWKKEQVEALVLEKNLKTNDEYKKWIESLDYFLSVKKLKNPDDWQS